MIETLIPDLVGAHFGVLEHVQRVVPEPDDVALEVYAGQIADTQVFAELHAPQIASGAALNRALAQAACLGEGVERYSAAMSPPGAIIRCCANELSGPVITPDQFALFTPRQYWQPRDIFPFVRWTFSQPLGWTQMSCLMQPVAGESAWMPAAFVWLPYAPASGEPLIAPGLSTGLACGTDRDSTTLSALCEVIERDALALAWLGKHAPPRIEFDIDATSPSLQSIIERIERRSLQWSLFDLTTDIGVPVAAAFVEGHSALGWIVAAGSACHPNPACAMEKALVEAAHCRMYVKSLLRRQPSWTAGPQFRNVASFADHARFYSAHPQLQRPLNRWRRSSATNRWDAKDSSSDAKQSERASPNELVEQIATRGYSTYALDVTPPDIADLGLTVARVVVPGLQPLHGNHTWPHLGGERLANWSRAFGLQARRPLRWNRYPHPWA